MAGTPVLAATTFSTLKTPDQINRLWQLLCGQYCINVGQMSSELREPDYFTTFCRTSTKALESKGEKLNESGSEKRYTE